MKKLLTLFTALMFLTAASLVSAQTVKSIQLSDGSTIQGKIVGMNNGVYTIDTPAMGTIELSEDKVMSIGAPGMASNAGAPAGMNAQGMQQQVMQMQQQIFADPNMMAEIQAMAQDPEIMQLLSDPALMQAATQMDVNGVSNNPNAQRLMQNPKMQELMQKMAAQQGLTSDQ